METDFCVDFEKKIFSQIVKLTGSGNNSLPSDLRLGLAVSGGADSVSLFVSVKEICHNLNIPLYVVTVNHNIREAEETDGDAEFVRELCEKNPDFDVHFTLKVLERGLVTRTAEERGGGIEEAARFLRYQAFENFINENHLDYLCLAHNKNDQIETLLMRFLQGNGLEGSCGISAKRGKFIRPLLETSRAEIEKYLKIKKITWRTDCTNSDTQYLRNKIRLKLVPFLSENFTGWQNALIHGAKKAEIDCQFINSQVNIAQNLIDNKNSVEIKSFCALDDAVKYRILLRMFNNAGENNRVPSVLVNEIIFQLKKGDVKKYYGNSEIISDGSRLFIKKCSKSQTDLWFSDIIKKDGVYEFPFGEICSVQKFNNFNQSEIELSCGQFSVSLKISYPFCIRNWQTGDCIKTKSGNYKKIADIFADWQVSLQKRSMIPLVQELETAEQEILCIFGKSAGFYNWVVNEKINN